MSFKNVNYFELEKNFVNCFVISKYYLVELCIVYIWLFYIGNRYLRFKFINWLLWIILKWVKVKLKIIIF